jgi:hypothetical protein
VLTPGGGVSSPGGPEFPLGGADDDEDDEEDEEDDGVDDAAGAVAGEEAPCVFDGEETEFELLELLPPLELLPLLELPPLELGRASWLSICC